MPRTRRALRRKNNFKKARRKRDIECSHRDPAWMEQSRFESLHQYCKDMPEQHYIHEDGGRKTNNRKSYGSKFNPPPSDTRRIIQMDVDLNEFFNEQGGIRV